MEQEMKEKKKREFKVELVLILILGFLLGMTMKTEALKRVTIGFDDYQLGNAKQAFDISAAEERIKQEAQERAQQQGSEGGAAPINPGASCN